MSRHQLFIHLANVRLTRNMMTVANGIRTKEDQLVITKRTLTDPCHLEVAQQGAGGGALGPRAKASGVIPFNKAMIKR